MYSRVYVEITNICNMHCSFCHGHSRKSAAMTQARFVHILQQLQGQTQYIYYHLMGEPLLHPQLPRFLALAKEAGFQSVITTNGTLLQKRGAELLSAGVHKVSVSIHSFEGAQEAAHRDYLRQVADFAQQAAQAGTLVSLRLWNQGVDEGKNQIALDCLRSCMPGEWKENTRGYRMGDKVFLEFGERFSWPDRQAPVQGSSVYCYGLKDHFGILCDGSVVPCCLDSEGAITLGNIFTGDIGEILASPRARAMAEGFRCRKATEELCRRCGYAQRF